MGQGWGGHFEMGGGQGILKWVGALFWSTYIHTQDRIN